MSCRDLVVVLVHHRTPERIAPAVAALVAEARELDLSHRVVVVDQSGDAPQGEEWSLLRPIDNLGYAGGFNAAVRAFPEADRYLLLNPDVSLEDGALGLLLEHCDADSAVGPMLFWDESLRLLQPPTREPEAPRWLRAMERISSAAAHRLRRRRWRTHARRHWCADQPLPTRHLSGACLLIGRSALRLAGPMDETFRLYYEETDWLRRLTMAGGRSLLVPSARGVHEFDASASKEPRRDEWFAASEALYRARYSVAPDLASSPRSPAGLPRWPGATQLSGGAVWFELSPFAGGVPAATERIEVGASGRAEWSAPPEVAARTEGFSLTLVSDGDRELGRFRLGASDRDGSE